MAEMFAGTAFTRNWLADAVRLYQLAADFRPANCAALYEHYLTSGVTTQILYCK
jgi:hypothetical protein